MVHPPIVKFPYIIPQRGDFVKRMEGISAGADFFCGAAFCAAYAALRVVRGTESPYASPRKCLNLLNPSKFLKNFSLLYIILSGLVLAF